MGLICNMPERAWKLLRQLELATSLRLQDFEAYARYHYDRHCNQLRCNLNCTPFSAIELEVTDSPDVRPWNVRLD